MQIFDISMKIHRDMPVYKDLEEKRPVISLVRTIPEGSINESVITMNVHTGTHIDAPCHVFEGGAGVDSLDLSQLTGQCRVLDLTHIEDGISEKDLKVCNIEHGDFLLLKTRNSFSEVFQKDFVFLEKSGAQYLADRNIRGIGIDSLGIERNQPGHETHKILMGRGVIIIEGLRLEDIDEGNYLIYALHINIMGADGAPARVVLIRE